jgi:hypothetical protein
MSCQLTNCDQGLVEGCEMVPLGGAPTASLKIVAMRVKAVCAARYRSRWNFRSLGSNENPTIKPRRYELLAEGAFSLTPSAARSALYLLAKLSPLAATLSLDRHARQRHDPPASS